MQFTSANNFTYRLKSWFNKRSPLFATRLSLLACILIAFSGIVLGALEDSLAVQTNGLIAGVDIINSLLFLAAVHRSVRSADVTYNYGYGKYESLAILASAVLLSVLLGFTLYEGVRQFNSSAYVHQYSWLIGFSTVSFLLMRQMSRIQKKYAEKFHMPMLQYDSELWRMDSMMEIGVFANLIGGLLLREMHFDAAAKLLDSVTAIVLIGVALKVPITHGKEAIMQLLDRTLPDEMQFDILAVVTENISRMCEFRSVHTRQSGKDIFIELDLVMPFDFTLEETFDLEKDLLDGLKEKFPTAIPRVYVVPCPRDCMRDGKCYCPVKLAREQERAEIAEKVPQNQASAV